VYGVSLHDVSRHFATKCIRRLCWLFSDGRYLRFL